MSSVEHGPYALGLTGSIGMGKSTVAQMFRDRGVPVLDADRVVHDLYSSGGKAVEPIRSLFPDAVVDGAVSRTALGLHLIGDQAALRRVEAAVHPLVAEERVRWLHGLAERGEPLALLDVPLLFETGMEAEVDAVAVVNAPADVQRQRVLARPGMDEIKLAAILARQVPDEVKRKRADFVIHTDVPLEETAKQVAHIIMTLRERREHGKWRAAEVGAFFSGGSGGRGEAGRASPPVIDLMDDDEKAEEALGNGAPSEAAAVVGGPAAPRTASPGQRAGRGARGGGRAGGVDAVARHERFQRKLAQGPAGRRRGGEPTAAAVRPAKLTPMAAQVQELQRRHPGVLLIIEVGYKFRFFGADAEVASQVCNIFAYHDEKMGAMSASVPVPRLHVHVRRLVEAGHKVGIVRQTETAALKKAGDNRSAPFTRRLTALYTRATLEAGDRDDVGDAEGAEAAARGSAGGQSYLVAVVERTAGGGPAGEVEVGMVAVETSTGDVLHAQFRDGLMRSEMEGRLMFAAPSELLIATPLSPYSERLLGAYCSSSAAVRAERVAGEKYDLGGAIAKLTSYYSSSGPGGRPAEVALAAVMDMPPLVVQALAHALDYLKPFGLDAVLRCGAAFRPFSARGELVLSPNALAQLEVLRNSDDGGPRGSLLWLLDNTRTAFGARLLRSWVAHPLCDAALIGERLDAVEELLGAGDEGDAVLARLGGTLGGLGDLERGLTRALHKTASPAELVTTLRALASVGPALGLQVGAEEDGMEAVPNVKSVLLQRLLAAAASREVSDAASEMLGVLDEAAAMENDRVALFASEARFPGVADAREELAEAQAALEGLLPEMRRELRQPRLQYTSVVNQGDHMIELPVDFRGVPKGWQKVAGTKRVNRYLPPAVKAAETQLELATERLQLAAGKAWTAFLTEFAGWYAPMRAAVAALAALDCLHSLAAVAGNAGYVRPEFVSQDGPQQLDIAGGRHPVLDALTTESPVVPNDCCLRGGENPGGACQGGREGLGDGGDPGPGPRALVVTGPNMGGKSCFIRQAALIVIMAQVGSFVPAERARMHVFDAVHTRMGASDNLAMGRSTFLEELSETSAILEAATPRSLVIVDELGRGTSTHDGLAIALATLEHLVSRVGCLTLFVTHYPKVAGLAQMYPGLVACRCMSYLQEGAPPASPQPRGGPGAGAGGAAAVPRITFLYKLVPGVADCSFGLNVARMAELPEAVVLRAGRARGRHGGRHRAPLE
ncbi:hypothetical protein WJX81_005994 [Elliptochloris bilobata]|uniref:DNA mismatch repair protein MSH3 n=1 Tax=Elliptochloris bilobata TaxID=381761 RepID=A0AAW1R2L6_9CHLO